MFMGTIEGVNFVSILNYFLQRAGMRRDNKMKMVVIGSVITFVFYIPGMFTNLMLERYVANDNLNLEFNSWMVLLFVMGYSGPIGGICARLFSSRAILRKQKTTTYWQRYGTLSLFLPALFVGGTLQGFNMEEGFRLITLMLGLGACLKAAVTNFVLAAVKFKPAMKEEILDEDLFLDNEI